MNEKTKRDVLRLIGVFLVIGVIIMLHFRKEPTFYDLFGLIVFVIIYFIGFKLKRSRKYRNYGIILRTIGILGFIVDGFIILNNFILKWL